ncbi:hypothetical protein Trydic_g21168 [Trypoxylus dichotomus]
MKTWSHAYQPLEIPFVACIESKLRKTGDICGVCDLREKQSRIASHFQRYSSNFPHIHNANFVVFVIVEGKARANVGGKRKGRKIGRKTRELEREGENVSGQYSGDVVVDRIADGVATG